MNEDQQIPPSDESVKGFFKRQLLNNEKLIGYIIKGLLALGAAYIGVKITNIEQKTTTIEQKTDKAADAAIAAKDEATQAQGVALKTQVIAAKDLVNTTGAKEDQKTLEQAKVNLEQHNAATQGAQ